MSGRILGYVMARDEWPLLGLAIIHALTNAVDHVVVVDHASTDGTATGLTQLHEIWPGRITVFKLQHAAFLQEATTAVILAAAGASEYDWVYVFDADEFLLTDTDGGLRQVLAEVLTSVDIIRYEVHQWIAPHGMRHWVLNDYNLITQRATPCIFTDPPGESLAYDIEQGYINFFDIPFQSKVVIRARYAHALAAGAHAVNSSQPISELALAANRLRVGHLPMVSRDRLNLRCRQGQALMEAGFPPGFGWQSQLLYRIELAGRLDQFWEAHSERQGNTSASSCTPTTVVDNAIAYAMRPAVGFLEAILCNHDASAARKYQPVINIGAVIDMTHTLNKERGHASTERDQALAGRDQAFVERDQAFAERDQAFAERDQAFAERDQAFAELDQAFAERDFWVAAYNSEKNLLILSVALFNRISKDLSRCLDPTSLGFEAEKGV
jgi:hypothetical protein